MYHSKQINFIDPQKIDENINWLTTATAIGAIFLGYLLPGEMTRLTIFPLTLGAIAIVASIIGVVAPVKLPANNNIMTVLYRRMYIAAGISAVGFGVATFATLKIRNPEK